jgi:serralysin
MRAFRLLLWRGPRLSARTESLRPMDGRAARVPRSEVRQEIGSIDAMATNKKKSVRRLLDTREWLSQLEGRQLLAIDGTVSRWSNTATDGPTGTTGTPINLTWNIVPDGTTIPQASDSSGPLTSGSAGSTFNSVTAPIGNFTPLLAQSFAKWSQFAGLTYTRASSDDGATLGSSTSGQLGVRADIRIGARSGFTNNNVLAYNDFPSSGGDMVFNSVHWDFTADQQWYFALLGGVPNTRFLNTTMHEHGHGLGLAHEEPTNGSKLMEPYLNTGFYGPQFDDIRRAQYLYGDPYEKTGANNRGGNNTFATASDLGVLANGNLTLSNWGDANSPSQARSISGTSDVDFLSFNLTGGLKRNVTFTLTPFGPSYQIAPQTTPATTPQTLDASRIGNLTFGLFNSAGIQLASVDATSYGGNEVISIPDLPAGTYYLRVGASQVSNITNAAAQAYNVTATIANYTPVAPTSVRLAPEADSGQSSTDGITNIATPIILGSGSPGDTVVVTLRNNLLGLTTPITSAVVGVDGTFRVPFANPLTTDGTWTIEAYTTYNGVNSATATSFFPVVLDRVLQPVSAVTMLTADDSGQFSNDGLTNVNAPRFTFSSGESVLAQASAPGQVTTSQFLVTSAGGFVGKMFSLPFADGAYTVTVSVMDLAGNSAVRTVSIYVDTVAFAPSNYRLFFDDDTGRSAGDLITRITNPRFQFNASDATLRDFTITAIRNGTPVQTVVTNGPTFSQWSPLADGTYVVQVRLRDVAGNTATGSSSMTIDTQAPGLPTFAGFTASPQQQVTAQFSELMVFSAGALEVTHIPSGQTYTMTTPLGTEDFTPTFTAEVTPNGSGGFTGSLDRDGTYRVTRFNGGIADVAGNALAATTPWFNFSFLRADFNEDGTVNFDDLLILAANYNQSGRTHAVGDADYSQVVNFDDLLILAAAYNTSVSGVGVGPANAPIGTPPDAPAGDDEGDSPSSVLV